MENDPSPNDLAITREELPAVDTFDLATAQEEIGRLRRELAALRAAPSVDSDTAQTYDSNGSPNRTALLEAMLETVPVGVVLADANGQIIHGNSWVERNLKHPVLHSANTEAYGEWVSFHADGRQVESHEYPLSRVIKDGEDHSELDVHYRRGDGSMFWMRVIGEPVRNAEGDTIGATVALVDIEDEVRLLEEKEILLGEVNHRVKNSLQLVGSILSLQARSAQDEAAALLQAASARVQAIASVHAGLYHDDDVRTVEFGDYLHRFCDQLADALGASARGITLTVDAEPLVLSADKAVPLSLIVNELVTNAFKYAFADDLMDRVEEGFEPSITVRLSGNSEGPYCVEVADNGVGAGTKSASGLFPDDENTGNDRAAGLGSTLTKVLARQLNAAITKKQADGWIVRLEFNP